MTYNDMTSGGKLRGISPALSHSALSLVHIHDAGQRGCLALLLSTRSKTDATASKPSHGDLLGILSVFSILARQTALHMNQGLRRASFPTAEELLLLPGGRSDALSALVYLRRAPPPPLQR